MDKFNLQDCLNAQNLMFEFEQHACKVAKFIFEAHTKGMYDLGDTDISDNGVVTVSYWDGYDGESYRNNDVSFPFEWLNKSEDELKVIRDEYWAKKNRLEIEKKKREIHEHELWLEEKRKVRASDEFQKYKEMQKKFEKYDSNLD